MQANVLANCRGATRAALDLDTGFGLAKVWTFTRGPTPIRDVLKLATIPDSARDHLDFFEQFVDATGGGPYALNVPCEDYVASVSLPPLSPRLMVFRDRAPTLNLRPQFNVAWSFGKSGFYTKLEKSYSRNADYFLTVEMGENLSIPLSPPTEV